MRRLLLHNLEDKNIAEKYEIRTQREAARYVGCDARTIRRWERDGKLKKNGDHYDHEELDECKKRSSVIRGLYDADLLRFREKVKSALSLVVTLRERINKDLSEAEQVLRKNTGEEKKASIKLILSCVRKSKF